VPTLLEIVLGDDDRRAEQRFELSVVGRLETEPRVVARGRLDARLVDVRVR
jgi:hypothetical protein